MSVLLEAELSAVSSNSSTAILAEPALFGDSQFHIAIQRILDEASCIDPQARCAQFSSAL
jgi:hypothetical protein